MLREINETRKCSLCHDKSTDACLKCKLLFCEKCSMEIHKNKNKEKHQEIKADKFFKSIDEGLLSSYSGNVFRPDYINYEKKQIKVGDILNNEKFWSASKNPCVAKEFLRHLNYQNTIFIIEAVKGNNIDTGKEGLAEYVDEEEVMILPFSSFEVKSHQINHNDIFVRREIHIIKLKYIYN